MVTPVPCFVSFGVFRSYYYVSSFFGDSPVFLCFVLSFSANLPSFFFSYDSSALFCFFRCLSTIWRYFFFSGESLALCLCFLALSFPLFISVEVKKSTKRNVLSCSKDVNILSTISPTLMYSDMFDILLWFVAAYVSHLPRLLPHLSERQQPSETSSMSCPCRLLFLSLASYFCVADRTYTSDAFCLIYWSNR